MKKVIVIIPHFNKSALLKKCIENLMLQNDTNFDILIVDNGSTDDSTQYIFNQVSNNKSIHSIMLSENMGFAYAVNKGLKYSIDNGYDYSILLNNDAFVEEDFVSELVKRIDSDKKLFAVSSLMLQYQNTDKVDSFGDYYTLFGWSFQGHLLESASEIEDDEEPFSACGGAAIYRNNAILKIGFFDEKFFAYLEDIDISYRARLANYKISTCKNAICHHLGSATTGSKYNSFKVRLSARNNIYLIYKNMPNIQIIINFLPLAFGTIAKLVFFTFKGFAIDYIKGILDGFKNLKYINRVKFNKVSLFTFIGIEFRLLFSSFIYIINFIKRHL